MLCTVPMQKKRRIFMDLVYFVSSYFILSLSSLPYFLISLSLSAHMHTHTHTFMHMLTPSLSHSSWMNDMSAVLMADELPTDVGGAEAVLSNHLEHKAEMDARLKSFSDFKQTAEKLVRAQHYASQDVWPSLL